jgi:hypothetical protein
MWAVKEAGLRVDEHIESEQPAKPAVGDLGDQGELGSELHGVAGDREIRLAAQLDPGQR